MRACRHPKLSKVHNRLCHHVSIVKTDRRHTWIISFEARTKKTTFREADPAKTGLASSQNQSGRFSQLSQMQEWIAPLHSSRGSPHLESGQINYDFQKFFCPGSAETS